MLLYRNFNVYRIVYMLLSSEVQVSITSPSFIALHLPVSELAKMYCLGAFIGGVFLQELHCLL